MQVESGRFRYGATPVLHEVSMPIAPDEHVALVGVSESGKTTLAALIAGLLTPQSGHIASTPERAHVVLLAQDPHTFSDPLRDGADGEAAPSADPDRIDAGRLD